MNKQRRKTIEELQGRLIELREEVQSVCDEEQEYKDNMPESFQNSQKGEDADDAISILESALNAIDEASDCLLQLT